MAVDIRHKAIEVLLATTAGAYQTTLLTYMIQRDLFPSIMKVLPILTPNRRAPGDEFIKFNSLV